MTAGDLLIEITPLAPQVLEAAAPDTKRRLERVAAAHRPDVGGNRPDFGGNTGDFEGNRGDFGANGSEGPPALFLVAFSTDRPVTTFEPGDLHLISRGLRQRPVFVEPITPGWGSRQLAQRSTALAVYGYPGTVDLSRELVVAYQGVEDSSWAGILAEIEAERARTTSEKRSRIS